MKENKLIAEFYKRFKSARGIADQWSSILEACYHYSIPFRNKFYTPKEFQGDLKNARLYDTTSVEATKTFVSKLHTAMTPPQVQWGSLELDDDIKEQLSDTEHQEIQEKLDNYMRKLFKYIHSSNFDVVINECYFDLAVGTSCLVINNNTAEDPLLFTSIPADKLAIEESFNGKIETWFRTWDDIKIGEIGLRWKNAVIPDELIRKLQSDEDAKVKIIYEGVLFMPKSPAPYLYMVVVGQHILLSQAFESNPAVVWRFQKTNNDIWGRGPVMDALPSIISLQEMARVELASANLNTFKPYMGFTDGIFNPYTFKLEPFTVIPISPIGGGGQAPLIPLPDSSNPQFAQMTIQDLRNQINTLLFADEKVEQQSVQPQTATEVSVNQQNLALKIGPLFSRLQNEFLEPLIMRVSHVLDEMGVLPKVNIDGHIVKFKYRSPLAQAKGQQQLSNFVQYTQVLQGIVGPEATQMIINVDQAPLLIAEAMQIDMRLINTPEQIAKTAQQQQEQRAQQTQEEAQAQEAQDAK